MSQANRINPLSRCPFRIEMLFNETTLGVGTAFFYLFDERSWLVTARHNLTGRHPDTGRALAKHGGLPNRIRAHVAVAAKGESGTSSVKREPRELELYENDDSSLPLWIEHSKSEDVDVAAIALDRSSFQLPVNGDLPLVVQFSVTAGYDAYVLGYPEGFSSRGDFPIWKRATIASEPEIELGSSFLIDTATRRGMSGAPVFAKDVGIIIPPGVSNSGPFTGKEIIGEAFRFMGIYTARPLADDFGFKAQLGKVFTVPIIEESLQLRKPGTSPF